MKEPKVQVGILFEPQIKFILLTPYHINGEEVSGKQVVTYDNGHILWQGHSYDELLFEPLHEKSDAFELQDVTIAADRAVTASRVITFFAFIYYFLLEIKII